MKTVQYYQLADLIKFESWDKLIQEEVELEDSYGIASIWLTIRTFESTIQEIINDIVAARAIVEISPGEKESEAEEDDNTELEKEAEVCPK